MFSPKGSRRQYLNITPNNLLQVFSENERTSEVSATKVAKSSMPLETLLTQPIACPAKKCDRPPSCNAPTPNISSAGLFTSPTNQRIISHTTTTPHKLPVNNNNQSVKTPAVGENERVERNNQINSLQNHKNVPQQQIPLRDQRINTTAKSNTQQAVKSGKFSFASPASKNSNEGQTILPINSANSHNPPKPTQGHSLRLTNKLTESQQPPAKQLTQNTDMDLFDDGMSLCISETFYDFCYDYQGKLRHKTSLGLISASLTY